MCTGQLAQTIPFTASGTLVGTGPGAVLRLRLDTASPPDPGTTQFSCPGGMAGIEIPNEGYSDRYGEALGQFDLPAVSGTKTVSRKATIGGIMQVSATAKFTVVAASP